MSVAKLPGTAPGKTHVIGPGGLDAAQFADWYRRRAMEQWERLDVEGIARLADWIGEAQDRHRHVYLVGNGGSAATASHMAIDFSKTAESTHRARLGCTSLVDNVAALTAIANDLSFDEIFSFQLASVLRADDVVLAISGSGNSRNLINAVELAKSRGAKTAALLGFDGGQLAKLVDLPILVHSDQYGVIEDLHISIGHIVTFYLKQRAQ